MYQEPKILCSCNLCNNESSKIIFVKNGFNLVQCSSCGLVYVGNPPSEAELEKLYSFGSGYHARFIDESSMEFKHHLNLARQYYEMLEKYKTQGRILDIGCSNGFFLKLARDNGWETYGLEMSKDTAELARKRYGLKVLTGTLQETSFTSKFFDVVTLWDVIEHVENPMKTISIISKILKDDGIVVLLTPNIEGLFPKLSYKVANIINYWPHPEPPRHLFQFSKKTIQKLLRLTGFNVIEIVDIRIPITYTFGSLKSLISSPKRFLYSAFFIPVVLLGPIVRAGDSMFVFAELQKRK